MAAQGVSKRASLEGRARSVLAHTKPVHDECKPVEPFISEFLVSGRGYIIFVSHVRINGYQCLSIEGGSTRVPKAFHSLSSLFLFSHTLYVHGCVHVFVFVLRCGVSTF